jgi:uncharacterized protein YbaA (DUF1428 family)
MTYVDGFVLSVKKSKIPAYKKMAKDAGKLWMKHGALQYFECVGEDMKDKGFCATFPKTIKSKPGEVPVFAFIIYKSRKHRDRVNAKVMSDPSIGAGCDPKDMPFDCKKMAYGGFETMVEY